MPASALALQSAFERAIERAEPSVVAVMLAPAIEEPSQRWSRNMRPLSSSDPRSRDFIPLGAGGSGVIVGAEGLVLTNYHVVAREAPVSSRPPSVIHVVLADRRRFEAGIYAADPRSDLAVLRLRSDPDPARPLTQQPRIPNLQPITLGDVSKLKKGSFVLGLGNPYTLARDGSASASWGIISNIGRKAYTSGSEYDAASFNTLHHFGTLLQTDARLNNGTSGGALINLNGEMIGLTTSLAALAGYEQSAGYAIPMIPEVLQTIGTLKQGREREYGFLGVNLGDPSVPDSLPSLGLTVAYVFPDTPADWAGMQSGDVISEIVGQPVSNRDDLMLAIGSLAVGDEVPVSVVRGEQRITLRVVLGKFPIDQGERPVVFTVKGPAWRGLRVDFASALVPPTSVRGDVQSADGIRVREVEPGTPAAKARLELNELITEVAGQKVRSPKDFFQAVQRHSGQPVQLRTVIGLETQVKSVDPS